MYKIYEYDAFVIYNPMGYDLEFVRMFAEIMESPPYNLRLFIPWRDYMSDKNDHFVSADLIENRYDTISISLCIF